MAMGGTNLNSGPAAFSCSDDVSDAETGPKVLIAWLRVPIIKKYFINPILSYPIPIKTTLVSWSLMLQAFYLTEPHHICDIEQPQNEHSGI